MKRRIVGAHCIPFFIHDMHTAHQVSSASPGSHFQLRTFAGVGAGGAKDDSNV
jgi:hypothetical protein